MVHFIRKNLEAVSNKSHVIDKRVVGKIYMLFAGWEVCIVKNCDRSHMFFFSATYNLKGTKLSKLHYIDYNRAKKKCNLPLSH